MRASRGSPRARGGDRLLLAALAAFGLALFLQVPLAQQPSRAQSVPPEGRTLYMRDCAYCHGPRGEGTQGIPPLIGTGAAGTDFYLSTGRMPVSERDVLQAEPREPIYTEQEIERIVAFVSSFGPGPAIPRVDPAAGDLGRGADLYLRNCAACHSATGIGAALTSGLVAPSLLASTPTEVAEAMQIGPGTMPVLSPPLDERDTNAIARYVQYLQAPIDDGGNALGHIGPIAEGFVGLAVGLGLILLVTRWIGERG